MSIRTPVSLLQEYTVKQLRCMPDYIPKPSDNPNAAFKYTVRVGSIVADGYGSTKQSAKHQSAAKALEQFGIQVNFNDGNNNSIKVISSTEPSKAFINYIGVLNELASTHGKQYPTYEDIPSLALFKISCSFLEWKTEGTGLNKKAAKQEAAQKMLQLTKNSAALSFVGPESNGSSALLPIHRQEQLEELTQRAIKKIEEMSLYSSKIQNAVSEDIIPQIVASSPIKTLGQLQKELRTNDYVSKIETLQTHPFIVALRIEGSSCVVMGQGPTEKEALKQLFETTLVMFIKNYNFKTYFEEKPFTSKELIKKSYFKSSRR